eukprot:jgi/Mesen1/6036/ME000308S05229
METTIAPPEKEKEAEEMTEKEKIKKNEKEDKEWRQREEKEKKEEEENERREREEEEKREKEQKEEEKEKNEKEEKEKKEREEKERKEQEEKEKAKVAAKGTKGYFVQMLYDLFTSMRAAIPAHQLPEILPGRHLDGLNKELLVAAHAHLAAEHAKELLEIRMTPKELMTMGRQKIRYSMRQQGPAVAAPAPPPVQALLAPRARRPSRKGQETSGGRDEEEEEKEEEEEDEYEDEEFVAEESPRGQKRKRKGKGKAQHAPEGSTDPSRRVNGTEGGAFGAVVAGRAPANDVRAAERAQSVPQVGRGEASGASGACGTSGTSDVLHEQNHAAGESGGARTPVARGDNDNGAAAIVTAREASKAAARHPRDEGQASKPCKLSAAQYAARHAMLSVRAVAWSPPYLADADRDAGGHSHSPSKESKESTEGKESSVLALGCKSGHVSLWRVSRSCFALSEPAESQQGLGLAYLGSVVAHAGSSSSSRKPHGWNGELLLCTGSSDGSVRLWRHSLQGSPVGAQLSLLAEVWQPDGILVTSLAAQVDQSAVLLAAGKSGGQVLVRRIASGPQVSSPGEHALAIGAAAHKSVWHAEAHSQVVTGVTWAPHHDCLFTSALALEGALDTYLGIALSPNGLALACVRGVAESLLVRMYFRKAQKGAVQLLWLLGPKQQQNALSARPSDELRQQQQWLCHLSRAVGSLLERGAGVAMWDVVAGTAAAPCSADVAAAARTILVRWGLLTQPHQLLVPPPGTGPSPESTNQESPRGGYARSRYLQRQVGWGDCGLLPGTGPDLEPCTTRQLQVACVLLRKLGQLCINDSDEEDHDNDNDKNGNKNIDDADGGGNGGDSGDARVQGGAGGSSSRRRAEEQELLQAALAGCEHELRQRHIMSLLQRCHYVLADVASGKKSRQPPVGASALTAERRPVELTAGIEMAAWVTRNASHSIRPALLAAAKKILHDYHALYTEGGDNCMGLQQRDTCPLCGALVDLDSLDIARCTAPAGSLRKTPHIFSRCMEKRQEWLSCMVSLAAKPGPIALSAGS